MASKISSKALIIKAKKEIIQGFDLMGNSIENPTILDRYFIAAAHKAINLLDSITVLCEAGLTDESIIILRSLIEHSFNMRWIAHSNSDERLKNYMDDLGEKGFGVSWTQVRLDKKMEEIGFKNRDYYDFCVKLTYSYSHVNAASLDWSLVFDDQRFTGDRSSADALYQVVAQMMGHVLFALNTQFKGKFDGYNKVWSEIPVTRDVRSNFEKVLKQNSIKVK